MYRATHWHPASRSLAIFQTNPERMPPSSSLLFSCSKKVGKRVQLDPLETQLRPLEQLVKDVEVVTR